MIMFHHICSVNSLISILKEKRFRPAYSSPAAGDSGINGYIKGTPFNDGQCFVGRGAELIIEWSGEYSEVGLEIKFPLRQNLLIRQGEWRAVISAQTESKYIKVVDFNIDSEVMDEQPFFQRVYLRYLKNQISKKPVYLTIKA